MIKFSVKVKSVQYIPELKLSDKQSREVGKVAISSVINRVQKKHTDIYDVPMPAYSPKPIYVKLGTSKGVTVLKSGRIPIISLKALRHSGVKIIDGRSRSTRKGKLKNAVVRTGNSVRFPNRAAYKRYIGASGYRDLTETGKMLGALVILSMSGIYAKVITIGFNSLKQEAKARGNSKITNWLGISPADSVKITRLVESMIGDNLKAKHA